MYLLAEKMKPYWGVTVVDGFEGMEGNGPGMGTPVPHKIAIGSTDYIAADRAGVECMGIDASYLGYETYLGAAGVPIAAVKRKYQLHNDIERELQWQGPMIELPPNVGWTKPINPNEVLA